MGNRVSTDRFWATTKESLGFNKGRFSEAQGSLDVEYPGHYVMPGFVDAHCHILPTGLDMLSLNLRGHTDRNTVLDAVRDRQRESQPGSWIHVVHYDQNAWPGGEHLTREELDLIAPDQPLLLRHSNGHASIANTAALRAANVGDDTPDPEGGSYLRNADGSLTGVLLEKAHEHVTSAMPSPELDAMVEAIMLAGKEMSKYGITTASDMMTGRYNLDLELQAYAEAAERGCPIRTRLYLNWFDVVGPRGIASDRLKELTDRLDYHTCKVAGLKIFADGAIGSATAAIHGRYRSDNGQGKLIYNPDRLKEIMDWADAMDWPVSVHSIGDRSTDAVMDVLEQSRDASRHRIEHAMVLSDDQIKRLAKLGVHVSQQPEFLKRFAHAYSAQLDPDVYGGLMRFRSLIDAGVRLSFSSDRPIVEGNPWDGIEMAVNRPEGFDPAENITLEEAVWLYTEGGADANVDVNKMGSIWPNRWADFQIYAEEPNIGTEPMAVYRGGERVYVSPKLGDDLAVRGVTHSTTHVHD